MKLCDITIAYNESSGGIRTYLDEKRRYLAAHTEHEHLLIVPGEDDRVEQEGRSTVVYVKSPLLPGQDAYRFFLRSDKIRNILAEQEPDIVELGSYYVEPWAAFAYRNRRRAEGRPCLVGCYFHTDVAEAYVASPLRAVAHDLFGDWSETLAHIGESFAGIAAMGIEKYIRSVFTMSDIAFAPSPAQAERLQSYGVDDVSVVPLGVDLDLFHPRQRNAALRQELGAGPRNTVLAYVGRLSNEKHVLTLVEALRRLPDHLRAVLWIVGEGNLADEISVAARDLPGLHLLPYERDRRRVAALLSSADIYVTAGPHETFALSVIEAQACGLPVVGVDAGALLDRVPPGLGLLGPVDDAEAMADNIVHVAAHRSGMGLRAREHVAQNFGWDSSFRRLLTLYHARMDAVAALDIATDP